MAKGNKKQGSKDFLNSPFKALKGIAVAKDKTAPPKEPVPLPKQEPAVEGDTAAFEREMSLLGVERRTADERERESLPPMAEADKAEKESPRDLSDEELFLASLGQMDNVFRDEIPVEEDQQEAAAAPRRMRQLRQGKRAPEARLDLHGLNRQEAREKVRFFLEDAVFQGLKTVLIITGRGKGSADGPVLRQFMEGYLSREARAWVVEWGRAPARYGGEGALVAFLKGRRGS